MTPSVHEPTRPLPSAGTNGRPGNGRPAPSELDALRQPPTERLDDDRPTEEGFQADPSVSKETVDWTTTLSAQPGETVADRNGFSESPPPPEPCDESARRLARELVSRGTLTPFQSEAVLAGQIDQLTLGRYILVDKLGQGGMGVVYEAYDRERTSRVALKTLPRFDADSLYLLKREFRARANLVHPNLVHLHELVSDGDRWFFTMEKVRGVNFLDHVGRRSGADPGRARLREALAQVAEGLIAIHGAGLLHRDIKPSNVLVTPEGRAVILDFGLVAELGAPAVRDGGESGSSPGSGSWSPDATDRRIVGTVDYMAPEQAAGGDLSPASDWYSVGVMLYEALAGRRPFSGRPTEVLRDKQARDAPSPEGLAPGLPQDLVALCMSLLDRDPQARPEGTEVVRRLRGRAGGPGEDRGGSSPASWTPFIGRERHLASLDDAFRALGRRETVAVFVHGRSGAGKSMLLQRFLEGLAGDDGVVVLSGRCYERESVPFKALDSLVDALSRYLGRLTPPEAEALVPREAAALARLFPVLRRVEALAEPSPEPETPDLQELRRRAFGALRALLARLGERKRLVLTIDDLQWGDADSAALLSDLLRPPDPPVLLLLGSYRSEYEETSACLRALTRGPESADRRRIEVEPLDAAESADLAIALLGRDAPDAAARARAIARESGGNPYFIRELVEDARDRAVGSEPAAPAEAINLDGVLWRRVLRLPEPSRRLLEVVALSGRPIRQADARRAADLEVAEDAAAVLRAGHLVRGTGPGEQDELESYHDRIRETVVAHLAPDTLRGHHARLAATLEAAGRSDPETLAIHFQGAGASDRAGTYYALAADEAFEALAFDRAATLYQHALGLRAPGGVEGRALRGKLGDALANAGRGVEAARAYGEAAALGEDDALALDLRRRAAYQFCISGHTDEGRAALRAVLQRVGMTLPSTPGRSLLSMIGHRMRLALRGLSYQERREDELPKEELERIDVSWSASAGLSMFDILAGADYQARNLLLALRAGEPYRVARALAWEAAHTSNSGGPAWPRTARLLEAARTLAARIDHPHAVGMATMATGIAEFTMGRWKNAGEPLDRAAEILRSRCTGVAWEVDTAQAFAQWALIYRGELAAMGRRSELLLREARERGDLYTTANIGTFMGPFSALAADDPEGALRLVRESLAQWSQEGFHLQHLTALFSETYIDLYRGATGPAWDRVSGAWNALVRSHFLRVQVLRLFAWELHARAALAAAGAAPGPGPLLARASWMARRIERERMAWGEPLARLVRAGIAAREGDGPKAAALLRAAAAGFDAVDMGLFAAAARRKRGELVGGPEGRAQIDAADAWMAARGVRVPARLASAYTPWGLGRLGPDEGRPA